MTGCLGDRFQISNHFTRFSILLPVVSFVLPIFSSVFCSKYTGPQSKSFIMPEIDPLIAEYEHDKFRPREAEALQTLRKVASLVKPIMRQRGWKVGILTEFWPPEKNLLGLNWNKGQKICLRLRYPYDERQFIPLEEVVDTMLHEYAKSL